MAWFDDIMKINKGKKDPVFNTETMLPVSEIQDDTIVLKDGGLRAILKVEGLNIDLKNGEDIEVIIEQYKKFLNWLDFPVQLYVRNNYLDLTSYIGYMKKNAEKIDNPRLLSQARQYLSFLDTISLRQNMLFMKEFYVIIPLYSGMQNDADGVKKPRWQKLLDSFNKQFGAEQIVAKYRDFLKHKKQLDTRCSVVMDGVRGLQMQVKRLWLADIVGLLFSCYNPVLQQTQAQRHQ